MPSPISLRLPKETADKIQRIAAIEHRSFAEMVRVLAEEALKMRAAIRYYESYPKEIEARIALNQAA